MKRIGVHALCFLLFMMISGGLISGQKRSRSGKTDKKDLKGFSERVFTQTELNQLKKTTTIFFLKTEDNANREDFERAIKSSWTFTKTKVASVDSLDYYTGQDFSFFIFEGLHTTIENTKNGVPTLSWQVSHFYLTLKYSFAGEDKRGRPENKTVKYCRIELFPDFRTMGMGMYNSEKAVQYLYQYGVFKNWSPGMLKLYLADVQKQLERGKRGFLFEEEKKPNEVRALKRDTLFVPAYVLTKFNRFNGDESVKHDEKKLFKEYGRRYVILDEDELSKRILNNEVSYVLDYVKSSTDNFIRVFSLSKGKIYQRYKPKSYNLKPKDLGGILE